MIYQATNEWKNDMRRSPWVDCSVLVHTVHRVLEHFIPDEMWRLSPGSFLEYVAGETRRSSEALVGQLLSEREVEGRVEIGPVVLNPADFPARGRLVHPGAVGEFFLPLWMKAGVLTCVCHTPLLAPSPRAMKELSRVYGVGRISVVGCLPWEFELYNAFVLQRQNSESAVDQAAAFTSEIAFEAVPTMDLEGYEVSQELAELVPAGFQRKFEVLPLYQIKGTWLTLAVERLPDLVSRTEMAALLPSGYSIGYVLADAESIQRTVSASTAFEVNVNQLATRLLRQGGGAFEREAIERIDFRAIHQRSISEDGAPAVTVLQALLLHAVRNNASDLHIARGEKMLHVEYRLDDWKHAYPETIPVSFSEPILARIKVLAELDLQRQTEPQMGKFVIDVTNVGEVEVRVTIMPTIHGDSATLRFARRKDRFPSLSELGLLSHEASILQRVIDGSYGMGLVVGPTGSGKSTTLYSLLSTIATDKYEVLSCEDPVERFLPGIKQTNVNRGLSYASYLAGALRADPDYIHIGETRTPETAEQVLKAAETGHIVLTTLHTHQACAAPARLFGLGIEPYMLADTLSGVVAQHLLPKLCPHCEEAVEIPEDKVLRGLGVNPDWFGGSPKVKEGAGCSQCRGRGAIGRMVVAEGFHTDSSVHKLILKRSPLAALREAQVSQGGRTLLQQAVQAASTGRVPLSVALSLGSSALS
ncbi:MAG: type IV pilus assembly protein PilB [Verrucomicrobia bacterium]|nr:MAG: type IV pilus assembly protein PilB [Verrucomicrobiota bacterium]